MLIYKDGDLLKSDCTVIMHQANCLSTMGAGIAKAISILYPDAVKVDNNYPFTPENRLGNFSFIAGKITIANLYGQLHYGTKRQKSKYEETSQALEDAMDKFLTYAKTDDNIDLSKVGVPYRIGAGLAGGDWELITKILERQSEKHNLDIYVYKI